MQTEQKVAHSPSPFSLERLPDSGGVYQVKDATGIAIADLPYLLLTKRNAKVETESNAHLFRAAPDLLAALHGIRKA